LHDDTCKAKEEIRKLQEVSGRSSTLQVYLFTDLLYHETYILQFADGRKKVWTVPHFHHVSAAFAAARSGEIVQQLYEDEFDQMVSSSRLLVNNSRVEDDSIRTAEHIRDLIAACDALVRKETGCDDVQYNLETYDKLSARAFKQLNELSMKANLARFLYEQARLPPHEWALIVNGKLIGCYAEEKQALDAGGAATAEFPFPLFVEKGDAKIDAISWSRTAQRV
jgi:hypothetical protein